MAALLVMLARCVLVATLLAAPWAIGGAELRHQRWLSLGVAIAGVLAWLGCVLNGSARLSRISSLMLLTGAALIGIGAFQLAPYPHAPELKRAELTETLDVLVGNDSPATARSLYPADTRLQMGHIALAICALLSGAWLFGERRARHWLWAILAVNGVALVGFGIIQRASWNDKLYWTIPLQLGGQPFAAFVNRNNAAEYLSMCLSGVLGLWAWRRTLTELPSWSGKARDGKSTGWFERIPATPWAVLILMLFGGVFATLSRGGALSAAAAILVIGVWAGATGRARTILLPLIGIVVAAGVWIAVSQQRDQLQARLSTVTRSLATDDRVGHWTDMLRALQDFSPWGSGLGAYRYANKPYERRKSEIWFDAADNQYLELLVDGGAVAGIVIVGALVLALVAAERWRRCGSLGEALAAGYLLIAIGLQSITNCWWMVSANVLTLATLAGALSAPARPLDDLSMSPLDKVRQLIETRGGLMSAAVAGLCVLVVAGLGLYEVTLAAESAEFRRRVPDDEIRGALADVELDGLLIHGEQLAVRRSDDAELHAALARLHYYRYRNQAAATLDAVAPARWSDAVRWERTSPQSLFATLARYRQIGDASAVARFREAPSVKVDFEPISDHLQAARRACPILPRLGLYEAIHELLNEGDPSLPLRREAALSPASVKLLLSLARSAEMIDDAALFETCLARCLSLDPLNTLFYVETARRRMSEPQIVERLLPAAPRQLLDFAEDARSSAGRAQALQRAADLIDSQSVPESERHWHRARIARLNDDPAGALELFKQSVEADPIEPNRRLDYASALFAQRDRAAALEQLEMARQLAPQDRRVQSRADELDVLLKAPRR